jgi:DNA-binding IclR family transcriptional regulator
VLTQLPCAHTMQSCRLIASEDWGQKYKIGHWIVEIGERIWQQTHNNIFLLHLMARVRCLWSHGGGDVGARRIEQRVEVDSSGKHATRAGARAVRRSTSVA